MEFMWNREVTRRIHKTLRWIIAAMKWTLQITVVIEKVKTKWGKVKRSTQIRCRCKNIPTKLPGVIEQARKAITHFEKRNCLVTDEILNKIFNAHINIFLLSNLPSAAKVAPNLHTKLR
jgi:hypothetical protein